MLQPKSKINQFRDEAARAETSAERRSILLTANILEICHTEADFLSENYWLLAGIMRALILGLGPTKAKETFAVGAVMIIENLLKAERSTKCQ